MRPAGKTDAGNDHTGFHGFFFIFVEITSDFFCHFFCLFHGGTFRHNDLRQQQSLIFVRQISGGHAQIQKPHGHDDDQKDNQIAFFSGQRMTDQIHVTFSEAEEHAVKPQEKGTKKRIGIFRRLMSGLNRLQQRCAKHGR